MHTQTLPQAFIWRRLHSLMGLWLVLFLMEHLLTNSQAALLLSENGQGFVRMVNGLHNLPYLKAIEITLLGVPIAIHLFWGVRYLFTGKFNSMRSDGSKPHLNYGRNHAYTWQRITSWILLFLLLMHIVKFRFLEYPYEVNQNTFYVKVYNDASLPGLADRLNVTLHDSDPYGKVAVKENEVIAVAQSFGAASLLVVRDTFKSPFWVAVYTVFVLSACFHAFNGLWTFMLTWGWVLNVAAQKKALKFSIGLMLLVGFLGLAAIWGSYLI